MKVDMAAPVTEVTEHIEQASSLGTVLHDAETWIAVSFVIFLLLALRYVKPFITKSLDERSTKIRDQLEQASRLRAEAEELLKNYRIQQEALLKEAEAILVSAKQDAAVMRTQATEELKATLARRTQQAEEKVARAEAEAIGEIRKRIIDAATESARVTLSGKTGQAADGDAIARALAQVERKIG